MTYKTFPNSDGSYDVLNFHRVLFHVTDITCKCIGRVNNKWSHPRKPIHTIPLSVMKFEDQIISKKL